MAVLRVYEMAELMAELKDFALDEVPDFNNNNYNMNSKNNNYNMNNNNNLTILYCVLLNTD